MRPIRFGLAKSDGLRRRCRGVLPNLGGERCCVRDVTDEFEPDGDRILARQGASTRGGAPDAIHLLAHLTSNQRCPHATRNRILEKEGILYVSDHTRLVRAHGAQPHADGVVGVVDRSNDVAGGTAVIEVENLLPRPTVCRGPSVGAVLAESPTVTEAAAVDHVTGGQLAVSGLHWCRGRRERRDDGGNDADGDETSQLGGTHGEVEHSFARLTSSLRRNAVLLAQPTLRCRVTRATCPQV